MTDNKTKLTIRAGNITRKHKTNPKINYEIKWNEQKDLDFTDKKGKLSVTVTKKEEGVTPDNVKNLSIDIEETTGYFNTGAKIDNIQFDTGEEIEVKEEISAAGFPVTAYIGMVVLGVLVVVGGYFLWKWFTSEEEDSE